MNVNELIEWPKVIAVVVLLMGVALAMFWKEGSPLSLGGMAVPIALFTGIGFFGGLPDWTVFTTLAVVMVLFLLGLRQPSESNKDMPWHMAAMAVALLGKAVIWGSTAVGPWLWSFLNGRAEIPVYGWMLALIIGIGIGSLLARSQRVKRWYVARRRGQQSNRLPTTT